MLLVCLTGWKLVHGGGCAEDRLYVGSSVWFIWEGFRVGSCF
jgi:hypothetical protein